MSKSDKPAPAPRFRPAPRTVTPQSAKLHRGETVRPPMSAAAFDKAGLPEGLRPAFGLGKPHTSGRRAPRD